MRIIKFRGRCAFSGVWRYGFYYVSKENHIIRDENDRESIVLEKTVGEFTGLHDKNGKEIFFGDILQTPEGIAAVVWEDAAVALQSPGSEAIDREHSTYYTNCEVIGTTFENPDLVKL